MEDMITLTDERKTVKFENLPEIYVRVHDEAKGLVLTVKNPYDADVYAKVYYAPDGENYDTVTSEVVKYDYQAQKTELIPIKHPYMKISFDSAVSGWVSYIK